MIGHPECCNSLSTLTPAAIVGLVAVLAGCVTPTGDQIGAKLDDPARSLWITVNSVPSGADVYGAANGGYMGRTPFTAKFTRIGNGVYSLASEQELLVYKREFAAVLVGKPAKTFLAFKCVVRKDGYQPLSLYQVLQDEESILGTSPQALVGEKSFTAFLQPVAVSHPTRPTQQQQQHQQTIIVPGRAISDDDRLGTIAVESTAENSELYVDSFFVGNTPATLKLGDGVHVIEVKAVGYLPYRKQIKVIGGSELTLRAVLEAE